MINSPEKIYYTEYYGLYLKDYISEKRKYSRNINIIIFTSIVTMLIACLFISKPIFANNEIKTENRPVSVNASEIYLQKNFEENIKNKYAGSYIAFPTKGVAHIKKIKYINSKPIKINIVEINTNVNNNLKIKPQTASYNLNSKATVRKIAKKENSLIAINAGFFKPQTGVPLGALVIDNKVLTGPIYNRVGIAFFEDDNGTYYKMAKISVDINAITDKYNIKINNVNQPRMLSTDLLMYTDDWGKISPPPPKNGYNLVIRNNKPFKISANPVPIENKDTVIQGNKEIISKLGRESYVKINISLQDELKNAKHIIGAGPYLVKNSNIYVDYKEQKLQSISGKNPRSAIGYKSDGTLIIVTIDGREQNSVGMTFFELAKFMKSIGCENAMNFDGGSSSALYIKGRIVNDAVNKEGVAVSNALVVNEVYDTNLKISGLQ